MRESRGGGGIGGGKTGGDQAEAARPFSKFSNHHLLHNHNSQAAHRTAYGSSDDDTSQSLSNRNSSSSVTPSHYSDRSTDSSPYTMSPWNNPQQYNSQDKSSWSADHHHHHVISRIRSNNDENNSNKNVIMIASLVREQGHIYSLAASGDLLYTGSDSKSIRVWKSPHEFAGFKSSSGFVKAIVISFADGRIFTGHQDGKIRVWKASPKNPTVHKRVGSLPRLKDLLKSSIKPSSYVEIRRRRTAIWFRHFDAISCLSLHEQQGILYSGSWDKTFKVWRLSDSKCLESVAAHDDAVNSIVAAFDGLVFTGSADGTVKAWRRELRGKGTQHSLVQTLLKHECAVTALVISPIAPVVYCGSSDGQINFWEWERQLVHGGMLRGHKQAVLCLAAAGSLVLSGSADATICVWRREGGVHSCLSVLTGHTGPVKCLAIVEDKESYENSTEGGRWIVYSGSLDKSVKVWRVSEQPAAEALLHGPQNIPSEPSSGGYHADGHDMDHDRRQRIWTAA